MKMSDWHGQEATHNDSMAAGHEVCGKCFSSMSKAAARDESEMYAKLSKAHSDMAQSHRETAEFHRSALKSIADELGKTIVPDNVRGIIPSNVPTAVPRAGAPQLNKIVDTKDVPLQFAHLVEVSDVE